jgi:cell shape-determining protein MreC
MIEYSNRSHRTERRARGQLVVATIVVIFIAFLDVVSGGAVRSLARVASAKVYDGGAAVSDRIGLGSFFRSRGSIIAENDALKNDIARLQDQIAANAALRSENEQLRAFTHLAQTSHGTLVPVVSSFQSSPFGTFLIDTSGTSISKDALVETEGGYVIGRVSEVGAGIAQVKELFAPHATISVVVARTGGQAEGQGGGNARLSVPRTLSAHSGDVVTSTEVGGRPVGVVGNVVSDPSGALATLYVRLPINLESIQFVYVLTP